MIFNGTDFHLSQDEEIKMLVGPSLNCPLLTAPIAFSPDIFRRQIYLIPLTKICLKPNLITSNVTYLMLIHISPRALAL
jgi:hypothetical protein